MTLTIHLSVSFLTFTALCSLSITVEAVWVCTLIAGMVEKSVPLIASVAFQVIQSLASFATLSTWHARVVIEIPGVSFKASQAKVIFITIEASVLTEIVKFWQIDIIIDILSLQLDMTATIREFVTQITGKTAICIQTDNAVGNKT